ncbi:EthD domain-containing protein [Rhodococcus sp. UNC363MFTsu5.1]|uniref:EthD domain-containing protein n=1 Tax=Rhodococcus sp. UNC363MFTsu5.1 TaxID=1449069 RepID=UPI000483C654|nr:EthD domain-containing protein [Rhodococcus sp. UNC363MFTsu5.1]
MKLMYALWGPRLSDTLFAEQLRERLAALGATRFQVNIDDVDVASAQLRLTTYEQPVGAIVSIWIPHEFAAVTEALSAAADRIAGWVVEERVLMPAPATANGVRTEALANVALLRIPAGMDRPEWLDRWQNHHTSVAIETQATFGYVQNTVVEPLTAGARVDALVEELFPMAAMTDPHAFYGSAGDDAELGRRVARMIESTATFGASTDVDVIPTSRYVYDRTGERPTW